AGRAAVGALRPPGRLGAVGELAALEVGQGQRLPRGQRVGRGQGDQVGFGDQELAVQAALVERVRQQGHVGAAVVQGRYLFAAAAQQGLDRQGVGGQAVGGQDLGEQARVEVGLQGQAQRGDG